MSNQSYRLSSLACGALFAFAAGAAVKLEIWWAISPCVYLAIDGLVEVYVCRIKDPDYPPTK